MIGNESDDPSNIARLGERSSSHIIIYFTKTFYFKILKIIINNTQKCCIKNSYPTLHLSLGLNYDIRFCWDVSKKQMLRQMTLKKCAFLIISVSSNKGFPKQNKEHNLLLIEKNQSRFFFPQCIFFSLNFFSINFRADILLWTTIRT